jgi:hypothetical protein
MIAESEVVPSADPIRDGEERHEANQAWFMTNPALWIGRYDMVVAIYEKTIIGVGEDHFSAYNAAHEQCVTECRLCPHPSDVTFVIVPVEIPDLPFMPDGLYDATGTNDVSGTH